MDEYSFDIGDIASELGGMDFGALENIDLGGLDLGGLSGLDLGDISPEAFYGFDPSILENNAASTDVLSDVNALANLGGIPTEDIAAFADIGMTPEQIMAEMGDVGGFPNMLDRENVFNAARDSEAYNKTIGKDAALEGYRAPGATPSRVTMGGKTYSATRAPTVNRPTTHSGTNKVSGGKSDWLKALLPLMLMMAMRDKQSGGSKAVIPALTAVQKQTPYSQQRPEGYRPGQGGIRYFEPVQYMPRMAGGGIVDLARALAAARREQRSRLLKGRGDGVSDSIPATIDGERPARLARGEYVVDARTVAELGNGSTDAGAERLDEMRRKVLDKRKKAGVGQDSKAYKHLPA